MTVRAVLVDRADGFRKQVRDDAAARRPGAGCPSVGTVEEPPSEPVVEIAAGSA